MKSHNLKKKFHTLAKTLFNYKLLFDEKKRNNKIRLTFNYTISLNQTLELKILLFIFRHAIKIFVSLTL